MEKFDDLKEADESKSKIIDSKTIDEICIVEILIGQTFSEITNGNYKEDAIEWVEKFDDSNFDQFIIFQKKLTASD